MFETVLHRRLSFPPRTARAIVYSVPSLLFRAQRATLPRSVRLQVYPRMELLIALLPQQKYDIFDAAFKSLLFFC